MSGLAVHDCNIINSNKAAPINLTNICIIVIVTEGHSRMRLMRRDLRAVFIWPTRTDSSRTFAWLHLDDRDHKSVNNIHVTIG